jgi:hypothetical protein
MKLSVLVGAALGASLLVAPAAFASTVGLGHALPGAQKLGPLVVQIQDANVTNVTVQQVGYAEGHFASDGNGKWTETTDAGDSFTYDELGRTDFGVLLNDPTRKIEVVIDVAGSSIWISKDGDQYDKSYSIIFATSDPAAIAQ